jgi:hypothetical protein
MIKFKKGDKVRCIESGGGFFGIKDEIYIVSDINGTNGNGLYFHAQNNEQANSPSRFELVDESTSDLDSLITKVNEGYDALRSLYDNHKGEFTRFNGAGVNLSLCKDIGHNWKVTKIEKPKFESFIVGNNWKVELDGEFLKIGCQSFNDRVLRSALQGVCEGGNNGVSTSNIQLAANRTGIRHSAGFITWEDADKILAALKKVGL